MAVLLAVLLWIGRITGLYDPGGRSFSQAQDRRLAVSGTVTDRTGTAGGIRLTLDHISFPDPETISLPSRQHVTQTDHTYGFITPGAAAGSVYHAVIRELNGTLEARDRIYIYLGSEEDPPQPAAGQGERIRIGDRAVFFGKCQEPESASNPGQFDSRSYYHARNVILMMRDAALWNAEKPERGTAHALRSAWYLFRNAAADLRIAMRSGMDSVFGEEDAPLAAAFLLGDKSDLAPEERKLFQDGGMVFLVSVSSLHISLLGMAVYRFLRRRRLPITAGAAAASGIVISYAAMTGMALCAQRALILFLLRMGAQIFGRTEDRLNELGTAAFIILLRQPYALWDASFLISCTCILSLELIPPAAERVWHFGSAIGRSLIRPAAIQVGTLPLILWYFYQICPVSILLHPVLLPVMSLLMAFGLAGSLLAVCAGGCRILLAQVLPAAAADAVGRGILLAGTVPASASRTLFHLLKLMCRAEQKLPWGVMILGRPHMAQVILYYILLILFLHAVRRGDAVRKEFAVGKRLAVQKELDARKGDLKKILPGIRSVRVSSAVVLLILLALITARIHPRFRYTCLDVGQGSCALIEEGGRAILFDAGSSTVDGVWQYRIGCALRYFGIRRLDTVILSHGDLDHISGMEEMLSVYSRNMSGRNAADVTIGRILLPDLIRPDERLSAIVSKAARHEIPVGYVSEGCALRAGEMKLEVLSPSPERMTGDPNQDSIVLWLERPRISILMTADMEKEGEAMLIGAYREDPRFHKTEEKEHMTCLVAGHHGSRNATSSDLLEMTAPDLVLISCGRNNRYGHPAEEMLQRLRDADIPWKRTDRDGAVIITVPRDR